MVSVVNNFLKKRLKRYIKNSQTNEKDYELGKIEQEEYYKNRFLIDKRILAVYELDRKQFEENEFNKRQVDLWFSMIIGKKIKR